MAFCNSCGAALASGATSCTKCGTAVASGSSSSAATPPTAPVAAPRAGGGSALKVVLIVIAVIVGLGILGIATVGFVGYRIARSSHVTQDGDRVKVETPLGTFSANDPEQAVHDLGVEVYPGAKAQKSGAASVTVAGIHTVTATFESSDPADKVCSFYKSKFPRATVTSSDQDRCTIVSDDHKTSLTINVESTADSTKFVIVNVTKTTTSSN